MDPAYRARLAQGDTRGAFATMVKQAGSAPRPLARMPLWYVRLMLRLAIRQREWRRMEPLLEANLAEHTQQALLDDGTVTRYARITADVLLCGGTKSPASITTEPLRALHRRWRMDRCRQPPYHRRGADPTGRPPPALRP